MSETAQHRLELSEQDMRALGYRVVDEIITHVLSVRERPIAGDAGGNAAPLPAPEALPTRGGDFGGVLDQLQRDVWSRMTHLDHPRCFAMIPSPNNFVSAMADALVAGLNPLAGGWSEAAGPAHIESTTIDWLRQLLGLPGRFGGHFVSGGSVANLTALAVARELRANGDAVLYCSDQTHTSIDRAMRLLGFRQTQLVRIPHDGAFRLDMERLQSAIRADRARGRQPFCVVGNAGTTDTGAVDPLQRIAAVCAAEGLWFHVDGAYGAAAAMTDEAAPLFDGIEHADSLSIDPHKWLFQPFESGCVLLRDPGLLRRTFDLLPAYLDDQRSDDQPVPFYAQGLQLSRSFRALKLWMSLKVFGADAFREAIACGLRLARQAERRLHDSAVFEVVSGAQLGIVCFTCRRPGTSDEARDRLNRALLEDLRRDGYALANATRLNGRTVIRFCTINPRTSEQDVLETISRLERAAHGH